MNSCTASGLGLGKQLLKDIIDVQRSVHANVRHTAVLAAGASAADIRPALAHARNQPSKLINVAPIQTAVRRFAWYRPVAESSPDSVLTRLTSAETVTCSVRLPTSKTRFSETSALVVSEFRP